MAPDAGREECGVPFGGGVSADVRLVQTDAGPIVVKRALPRLRVQALWESDPRRYRVEVDCLRVLAAVLGPDTVPRVLWVDDARATFAMERIPERFQPWRQVLFAGHIDEASARRVGELLGQLHSRTAARADLAARFADQTFLLELRVRPYHERIAARHPALAPAIDAVVQRMRASRQCLVHGDYSPKNLLVDGAAVVILDCEVAHWGDPRFDIAFCLSHLLLKVLSGAVPAAPMAAATRAYLAAYAADGLPVLDAELARATACLLLARMDGDSPVDYIRDETRREAVRGLARSLLLDPPAEPAACVARALEAASPC